MNYNYTKSLLCCIYFLYLSQCCITKKMNTQTSETTPPKSQNPLFRVMVISKQVTGKITSELVKRPAMVAGAVVGVVAAPVVVPIALGSVGFSSTGVIGGSIAAGLQASTGNVVAGSAFAACQSMAMGGAINGVATATVGAAGATTGGLIRFVKSRFNQPKKNQKHKNENENENESEDVIEPIDNLTDKTKDDNQNN